MKKIFWVVLIVAINGVGLFALRPTTFGAQQYYIIKGKQNFSPKESILPRTNVKGFTLTATLDSSCYYSQQDWTYDLDRDRFDWNKLKGLSRYWTANNHTAAMFAWRPDTLPYHFQIAAYTNYPKTEIQVGEPITVAAGQSFSARCDLERYTAKYLIEVDSNKVFTAHSFRKKIGWAREVGTYFGGANNSPGPYGGKAPQNMVMHIYFSIIK